MRYIILLVLMLTTQISYSDSNGFSYAVLDYEYVIQNSKVFQNLESKIEAKRSNFFSEAQKAEKFLTKQRRIRT